MTFMTIMAGRKRVRKARRRVAVRPQQRAKLSLAATPSLARPTSQARELRPLGTASSSTYTNRL